MNLNSIYSVHETAEAGVFRCLCNITDADGDTYDCEYVSREEDPFGLALVVRAAIKEWIAADKIVDRFTPPSALELRQSMTELTARRLRLGLIAAGISPSEVQNVIETLPDGVDKEKAKVEWEFASIFQRTHPLIALVAAALGLADELVDAMWLGALEL